LHQLLVALTFVERRKPQLHPPWSRTPAEGVQPQVRSPHAQWRATVAPDAGPLVPQPAPMRAVLPHQLRPVLYSAEKAVWTTCSVGKPAALVPDLHWIALQWRWPRLKELLQHRRQQVTPLRQWAQMHLWTTELLKCGEKRCPERLSPMLPAAPRQRNPCHPAAAALLEEMVSGTCGFSWGCPSQEKNWGCYPQLSKLIAAHSLP